MLSRDLLKPKEEKRLQLDNDSSGSHDRLPSLGRAASSVGWAEPHHCPCMAEWHPLNALFQTLGLCPRINTCTHQSIFCPPLPKRNKLKTIYSFSRIGLRSSLLIKFWCHLRTVFANLVM